LECAFHNIYSMAPAGTLFGSRRLGASTAAREIRQTRDEIKETVEGAIDNARTDVMDFVRFLLTNMLTSLVTTVD